MPYLGECRLDRNILHQYNGKKWVRVPDVPHPEDDRGYGRIHFDIEDALHDDNDPVDKAFRPRR